jgi:hypothetical protein
MHKHTWVFSDYCGVKICTDLQCLQHYDLSMCYCGWANDLAVGARATLSEYGENIDLDTDWSY